MTQVAPAGASVRRQAATADRALACAAALEREIHGSESGILARRHAFHLCWLARRSEAVGLPRLAEVARLTVSALAVPRRPAALVAQAVDVLTLAGLSAKRRAPADLDQAVAALREHVRYVRSVSERS
jgi:hypothetical protein